MPTSGDAPVTRAELRVELEVTRAELKADLDAARAELKADIAAAEERTLERIEKVETNCCGHFAIGLVERRPE